MNRSHIDDELEQIISELQAQRDILAEALEYKTGYREIGSPIFQDRKIMEALSHPDIAKHIKIQEAKDGVVEAASKIWMNGNTAMEVQGVFDAFNHLREVMREE